uniref:Uncharacterized protein n=1 Tax=uncultured marine virus TaxID=186617 RepID=A0A0F7L351_9VIRU|nr:hypothetical protein [uncultured marine virus]
MVFFIHILSIISISTYSNPFFTLSLCISMWFMCLSLNPYFFCAMSSIAFTVLLRSAFALLSPTVSFSVKSSPISSAGGSCHITSCSYVSYSGVLNRRPLYNLLTLKAFTLTFAFISSTLVI